MMAYEWPAIGCVDAGLLRVGESRWLVTSNDIKTNVNIF